MRKYLTIAGVLILAAMPLFMSVPISAQDAQPAAPATDPATVLSSIYEAINAGDVETAITFYDEDAVHVLRPAPPDNDGTLEGADQIKEWREAFVGRNGSVELSNVRSNGDTVLFDAQVTEDIFTHFGVAPLEFSGTAVVRDGKVVAETLIMSDQSEAVFGAAIALEGNRELIRRFYDEIWNEGNMDTADEIIASDFIDGFTGNDGVDSLKEIVTILRAAYPDFNIEYEDMVAEGDVVVVRVKATGTYGGGAPDFLGIPDSAIGKNVVVFSGVDYARFEDGQMAEGWGVHDDLLSLKELGYEVVPPTE